MLVVETAVGGVLDGEHVVGSLALGSGKRNSKFGEKVLVISRPTFKPLGWRDFWFLEPFDSDCFDLCDLGIGRLRPADAGERGETRAVCQIDGCQICGHVGSSIWRFMCRPLWKAASTRSMRRRA